MADKDEIMRPSPRKLTQARKYIKQIQKEIPPQYHQMRMMDYLFDPEVLLYSSITSRFDGKTYNYFLMCLKMAIKFKEFRFFLLCRHFTQRDDYIASLYKIMKEQFSAHDRGLFAVKPKQRYSEIWFNNEIIGIISDLNSAGDLKNAGLVIDEFRLLVFDEFIALDDAEYNPYEIRQIKTIYETVQRPINQPTFFPTPKIIMLGNPLNYSSPELEYWNLYQILQKQKMNTCEKHGMFVSERERNERVQENVNFGLFGDEANESITGEFKVNDYLLASPDLIAVCNMKIIIKTKDQNYLIIHFNLKNRNLFYFEFSSQYHKNYNYCQLLSDLKEGVQYLHPNEYFIAGIRREHENGKIKYLNNYTEAQFDRFDEWQELDYHHILSNFKGGELDQKFIKQGNFEINAEEQAKLNYQRRFYREYLGL